MAETIATESQSYDDDRAQLRAQALRIILEDFDPSGTNAASLVPDLQTFRAMMSQSLSLLTQGTSTADQLFLKDVGSGMFQYLKAIEGKVRDTAQASQDSQASLALYERHNHKGTLTCGDQRQVVCHHGPLRGGELTRLEGVDTAYSKARGYVCPRMATIAYIDDKENMSFWERVGTEVEADTDMWRELPTGSKITFVNELEEETTLSSPGSSSGGEASESGGELDYEQINISESQ